MGLLSLIVRTLLCLTLLTTSPAKSHCLQEFGLRVRAEPEAPLKERSTNGDAYKTNKEERSSSGGGQQGGSSSGPWNTVQGPSYISFIRKTAQNGVQGPMTSFAPTPFSRFSVKAEIRLLDDVTGALGQGVLIMAVSEFASGKKRYYKAVQHPKARKADGWILLQGDFRVPDPKRIRLKLQGLSSGVRYQVANGSVTDVWQNSSQWSAYTDTMIDQLRKSDIRLNVTTTGSIDPSDVEIQVVQTKKSFPLGTAVNSWAYRRPHNTLYRKFIHNHFSWAVHESAMKWFNVEKFQGQYRYGLPLSVLRRLRANGLKVRGHALMWSVDVMVPGWVRSLSTPQAVRAAVQHHIHLTMNRTQGLLEHWDVNNENMHGHWYQTRLEDFDYEQTPYRLAHQHDPSVQLFLNDFNVVAHGSSNGAYVAQAERLKKANVGLSALGAQCHFYTEEMPDPFLIKDRLDRLAETGLPVWVTEFNIVAANESKRALALETAMRAFYSHPAVEGIVLWGFWDRAHSRGPHAALVSGPQFRITEAGKRFLDLWEKEWMTNEERTLQQSGPTFTVRGFHGDYQVRVRYQGKELSHLTKAFHLGKSPLDLDVAVYE